MARAADLRQIQIYSDDRDVREAVDPQRSAITGEPSARPEYPEYDPARPEFRLSQAGESGHRECLAFGWKVVPLGRNPASASDFEGGRLPSGIVVVPKDGPASYETYLPIRVVDDRITERNEHFRIELLDKSGMTIWGAGEPNHDLHGFLVTINPSAAVYTIHDTERDCATPGAGSGYTVSVQALRDTYRLVIEEPEHPQQCAYVGWRYIDDTLPDPHPDAETFLQGMAYFSSDEDSAALGGNQQWFDLGIPVTKENAGRKVRVAWALGSNRPAITTLTLPVHPQFANPGR
jgi:hypothetical protein